jgi:hypothetical protein
LKEFVRDPVDEDVLIELAEEFCSKTEALQNSFHLLLPPLWEQDILSEDSLTRWKTRSQSPSLSPSPIHLATLAKFRANVRSICTSSRSASPSSNTLRAKKTAMKTKKKKKKKKEKEKQPKRETTMPTAQALTRKTLTKM